MAAQDTFESYNASLSKEDQEHLKDFIRTQQQELLAARSEDARVRIVHEHIQRLHELQQQEH